VRFEPGDLVEYQRDDNSFPRLIGAVGMVDGIIELGIDTRYSICWFTDPTGQLSQANQFGGFDPGVLHFLNASIRSDCDTAEI
jgi:hypothetical protein